MRNIRTAVKLPAIIVVLAVASAVVTGLIANNKASEAISAEASSKLLALSEARTKAVDKYLASIQTDLVSLSENEGLNTAMKRFAATKRGLEGEVKAVLQKAYITENPHPKGERHKLEKIETRMAYAYGHQKYHPWLTKYALDRRYPDIYLVDPEGDVIYSVFKNEDFATNLIQGEFKDSGLAKAFHGAMATKEPGAIAFVDFAQYAPADGAPAGFIASPIREENNVVGVLVYRMPIDEINAIMQPSAGLGKTGETYLVGRDMLMRSDTRSSAKSTILSVKVETEPAKRALAGEKGMMRATDYRGLQVFSSYGAIEFAGVTFAVIAEISADEVTQPTVELAWFILGACGAIVVLVSIVGLWFSRTLTTPISAMTSAMAKLANGELDVPVPGQDRKDEIGDMAAAVQVFKENAQRVAEMENAQAAAAREAEEQKKAAMRQLADEFEASVGRIVRAVSTAAGEMRATGQSLSASADQTSSLSASVTAAAEETYGNVEAVSAAAEELSASISEISRQVTRSSEVSRTAVSEVEATNDRIQGLAEAAEKIGAVVNLISDIAEQTNLLALNATIEAARAGDSGKGFAVVASEVKSLADQTARATNDISTQIVAVQSATREAVAAIGGIVNVINQINEIAGTVAAAVEEQGAATGEIARNAEKAATGVSEVTTSLGTVSQTAVETGENAQSMGHATSDLSTQAEMLSAEVEKFLRNVRAA